MKKPFPVFSVLGRLWLVVTMVSIAFVPVRQAGAVPADLLGLLSIYPNIETAGIVVSGADLPASAQMMYRRMGESTWREGHPLMRIDDGRLVGSLFELSPSTSYEVKVMDGVNEITGAFTTQVDELLFTPSIILWVDDDAQSGGDGSSLAPFKTIQEAVNRAVPGTQVLVADGVYREAVTFSASGTAGNWIQVKAEGSGAVLDGSILPSVDVWQPHESKNHVWFMKPGWGIKYLARNGQRFYQYDTLHGLLESTGHNNVNIKEGWFYDPPSGRLYIRIQQDPVDYSWQIPQFNQAFGVDGYDWIWIEGFEIRYYGTGYGCGVCANNASHIVIRKNKIHNLQNGVFILWTGGEDRGNDTRIEYNEISDPPLNEWPWNAVKGTGMEATAIVVRGHIGAIVRGNHIHHYFNGIYTSSSAALYDPEVAFDLDVYGNNLHHISDDALEPEGACVNHRFRNNRIDSVLVGISLAPVTAGPVWVMRSTITNFSGRSIKFDRNSDGWVLIYHNTSWTNLANRSLMEMISAVHNTVIKNNIFQGNGYAIEEAQTGSSGHDWNYNNWSTSQVSQPIKWENILYADIDQFCASTGLECNGHQADPGLAGPAGGDLTLSAASSNLDRGVKLPGINDGYRGSAPDLGAFESTINIPLSISAITRLNPNPSSAESVDFQIEFSKPVHGIDLVSPFGDFILTVEPSIQGAFITGVTTVSETKYHVHVSTGTGSGDIRLDVTDDDSIQDSLGNPLGGQGAGNGNFTTGESYTMERSKLSVVGVTHGSDSPATPDVIQYELTLTGNATGVDASDLRLTSTGTISDPKILEVTGSGAQYTVLVQTGTGEGTLQLDVVDDDTIVGAEGHPLGGSGTGNGDFTAGEPYLINRSAPFVLSSLPADPDPASSESVRYLVEFSESVSGVDPADFVLTTSGLNGAVVTSVSGYESTYLVTVFTGSGSGTLRLDVVDDDSIMDVWQSPLGGMGAGNGIFQTGFQYTIEKFTPVIIEASFSSGAVDDGWVLESKENSNRGGTKNSNATTLRLGDNGQNNQYRVILHFSTSSLPDNAVVTQAILMFQQERIVGGNPFLSHGRILVDIRKGAFGSFGPFAIGALQTSDFQAPASYTNAGAIINNPVGGWYWATLDGASLPFIHPTGITQLRLGFELDDDNDRREDYLSFFSGNFATDSARPQLKINYYLPK